MIDIKLIFSLIAIFLIFVSYYIYIRDILKGKIRPHIFTWFLWSIIIFILFILQFNAGAGFGSLPTFLVSIFCLLVAIISFIKETNKDIRRIDKIFFIITIFIIFIWILSDSDFISTILLILIYSLAAEATIRKIFIDPYSEDLSIWIINGFRGLLSIFAIENYNLITLAFPSFVLIAGILFFILILIRRKILKNKVNNI